MKHTDVLAEYLAEEPLTPDSISKGAVPIGLLVESTDKLALTDSTVSECERRNQYQCYTDTICRTEAIDLVAESKKILDAKLISKPISHLDVRTTGDPFVPITVFYRPE